MVGTFLECSVAARPLAPSFEFYSALGFTSIPVGDTLHYPYLVFFDGDIAIGLHDLDRPSPRLTFVRPNLKDYVRALRRLSITLDDAHLADHEFHRVGFTDPTGQSIELLEARTFPPGDWNRQNVSACGKFLEFSLPTDALDGTRDYWQQLGFRPTGGGDAPHPWLRLEGHGVAIGLHETHFRAGLSFRAPHLEARLEYLRAKGITTRLGNPLAARDQHAATLTAPEGTPLYLFDVAAL
jgi:hypothetical protein